MANVTGIPVGVDNIVQIITILGGGTVIGAVVNGFFSRRKSGADATKVLQEAASGLVADLERQMLSMSARVTQQDIEIRELRRGARGNEHLIDDLRSWKAAQERLNTIHGEWDTVVVQRLAEEGITLPPPPPLATDDHR